MVEIKEMFGQLLVMDVLDNDVGKIFNAIVHQGANVKIGLANMVLVALNQVLNKTMFRQELGTRESQSDKKDCTST